MKLRIGFLSKLFLRLFSTRRVETPADKVRFRHIWTTVWLNEGYVNEREPLDTIEYHYKSYDEHSADFLLLFFSIPVGTIRLIWESNDTGLPVTNDFDVKKIWSGKVVEFTLLALNERFRNKSKATPLLLMREAYRLAKKGGAEGILMAADKRLFYLLSRNGIPLKIIGPEKFYEGSDTIPAYINIAEAESKLSPKLMQFFNHESVL
jgi:hypothetical protein